MTSEQWQQVKRVLHEAMQVPPEDRTAFLEGACAGDVVVRREVESLLESDSQARSTFLRSPFSAAFVKGTRFGDYEILSILGVGGMGEVYRARDTRLKRDVAIKALPAFVSVDPDRLRRFEQEALAAAALNHPNILSVYQFGTYEGAPFLVTELLEGETLRQRLQQGPIHVREALNHAVQIAQGLSVAHDKGIVHRDLKPENLFVTKDGRMKILDFGLAKLVQHQHKNDAGGSTLANDTDPGTVMGTPGYMSPEQARGESVDHRADIFAFGAILYEMLTGKRAFQRASAAETIAAILNDDPLSLTGERVEPPRALDRLIRAC